MRRRVRKQRTTTNKNKTRSRPRAAKPGTGEDVRSSDRPPSPARPWTAESTATAASDIAGEGELGMSTLQGRNTRVQMLAAGRRGVATGNPLRARSRLPAHLASGAAGMSHMFHGDQAPPSDRFSHLGLGTRPDAAVNGAPHEFVPRPRPGMPIPGVSPSRDPVGRGRGSRGAPRRAFGPSRFARGPMATTKPVAQMDIISDDGLPSDEEGSVGDDDTTVCATPEVVGVPVEPPAPILSVEVRPKPAYVALHPSGWVGCTASTAKHCVTACGAQRE